MSSSDSGDLFFYGTKKKSAQPPPPAAADDEDEDETHAVVRPQQGRPGRPAKRRREDLAATLREPDIVIVEEPQSAPPRNGGGARGTGVKTTAADDDVDAWFKGSPPAVKQTRPASLTAEQQALLRRNELLRQELAKTEADEDDLQPEAEHADDVRVVDDTPADDSDEGPEEEEEETHAAAAEPGGSFMVVLRTDTGVEQKFNVRPDTAFGKLFDAFFARHAAIERRRARFKFDGETVRPEQTPEDLDIDEDGYVIEVVTK